MPQRRRGFSVMSPTEDNEDDALIFTGVGSLFTAIAAVLLNYPIFAAVFAFFSAFALAVVMFETLRTAQDNHKYSRRHLEDPHVLRAEEIGRVGHQFNSADTPAPIGRAFCAIVEVARARDLVSGKCTVRRLGSVHDRSGIRGCCTAGQRSVQLFVPVANR